MHSVNGRRSPGAVLVTVSLGAVLALRCGGRETDLQRSTHIDDAGKQSDGRVSTSGAAKDGDAGRSSDAAADASVTGPVCRRSRTGIGMPECVAPAGVLSEAPGATCLPSPSFNYACPDVLVGGAHLRGCCPYGAYTGCGFRTTLAGQSLCIEFEDAGTAAPDCPPATFGETEFPGCRSGLGSSCMVRYRTVVDGVELDFGCVPFSLLSP